ncbi:Gti1/Pac2 family-domain-containing protein [Dendryphion nanum]|uniref:Gti1/Pac2 family-domain-containing protein n=1 Tax=Dendryphion nanum TaxID=256645 RepID=A0A9P9DPB7_9PLEO|nr:Gti1/Pac2 family-domain-containing protein [Dendryphion nanum]
MLQGIRASPLTMPSFGHGVPLPGAPKLENYADVDPWSWSSHHPTSTGQSYPAIFDSSLYNFAPPTTQGPQSVQPRHHSIATSHLLSNPSARQNHTATPPPPRHQIAGTLVKAQPAFKATWHGFLDTTKDAMTVVEAALLGRLSHISRRPHDKERAEMLTSGTVLVYEENASGIKRWTDAVHWSPSRVMNNCLIYRQLVRALKPEEKKSALNPTCGAKRKRKESASPSITNTGENINNADDEYENSAFDALPTENAAGEKVYANFAQSLSPDQQRRFCGSLIDSYEFKEGGLMKKTISVKYNGTHHHVISYYSLEDVVAGKLKRPFQDAKLVDIQPRPELLTGWKVSLEDEESKEMPYLYPHHAMGPGYHSVAVHGSVQSHAGYPLHLSAADYWQGGHVSHYAPPHHAPAQHYPTSQHTASSYAPQSSQQYQSQSPQTHYPQQSSPQHYSTQPVSAQEYSPTTTPHQYSQHSQSYPSEQHVAPTQQYTQPHATSPYPTPQPTQAAQPQTQYTVPQAPVFDLAISVPPPSQSHTPVQQSAHSPVPHHDPQRRASAPVALQTYGQTPTQAPYSTNLPQPTYYVTDHKFSTGGSFGY